MNHRLGILLVVLSLLKVANAFAQTGGAIQRIPFVSKSNAAEFLKKQLSLKMIAIPHSSKEKKNTPISNAVMAEYAEAFQVVQKLKRRPDEEGQHVTSIRFDDLPIVDWNEIQKINRKIEIARADAEIFLNKAIQTIETNRQCRDSESYSDSEKRRIESYDPDFLFSWAVACSYGRTDFAFQDQVYDAVGGAAIRKVTGGWDLGRQTQDEFERAALWLNPYSTGSDGASTSMGS